MSRSRAVLSLSLLLVLLMVTGCGSDTYIPVGSTGDGSGPPVATQAGSLTIAPQYAADGSGGTTHFKATVNGTGTVQWMVNGVAGGTSSTGTVDANGNYTAPSEVTQAENITVTASLTNSPGFNYASAIVSLLPGGIVTSTTNPQVASYSIILPMPGTVYVEFGQNTGYGFPTSVQATPTQSGAQVIVLVAGMLASTTYHMRAQVVLSNGAVFTDIDHTFTTGIPPPTASVAANAVAGGVPQPGIELFDTIRPREQSQAFATDLNGNVIWTYLYTGSQDDFVQPVKLLPNGHFLVQISYASSLQLSTNIAITPGTIDEVREVDLVGNTIRSVTQAQVASALTAQGYTFTLGSLHHDVLSLPNGHMLLLFSVTKSFTDLPGYPGTTNVLGDVLVDVDQNFNPDWVWNSFDHLDVNRHPFMFPDWTHSNAMLYSTDDHNVLLSVRHQNWIIKIDFQDGKGSGNIIWRLGQGGDFQLQGGVDPTDWFYAQHGPNFFTPNTTGVFQLGIMDDGDDRQFPPGVVCGVGGAAPCLYSTAPVLEVNESQKTATLVDHYVPPASTYSFFGGNVELLANGNLEADFCATVGGSVVQEVKGSNGSQQVVWQAVTRGSNQYRAFRMPSLYPGVQW